MSRMTALRFALAGALVAAAGCAQNIVQERAAGPASELAVARLAVVPFRAAPRAGADPLPEGAAALVGGYVAEGFAGRGLDAVPPSDVEQAIGEGARAGGSVVQLARDRFGAEAVVIGTLYRFRERGGQALGTTQPASVGFEVKIYTADGKLFRSFVFDHTQVALSENALTAAQYPGGGTRWLTAEELARWGALRVVQAVPIAAR
jgi:hypothetical protein